MNSKILPILNAVGCMLLVGLVIFQWRREHESLQSRNQLLQEIATSQSELTRANHERAALLNDITLLKESLDASQTAAEKSAEELRKTTTQLEQQEELNLTLQEQIDAAREQLQAWEQAVKERDERIRILDLELDKTRKQLDLAVSRLRGKTTE
ncbi:MAG: hypothetical protein ACO3RV_04775 [Luteolibacter sp.]